MLGTTLQKKIKTLSSARNFGFFDTFFDILERKAEKKQKQAIYFSLGQYVRLPDDNSIHGYIKQQPSVYLKDEPTYFLKSPDSTQVQQIPLTYPVFCSALIANLYTIADNKDSKLSSVISKAKDTYHDYDFSNVLSQIIRHLRQEYNQNWDRNYEHLSPQLAFVYCALLPAYRKFFMYRYFDRECIISELPILSEYDLYHQISAEACIKKTLQMQEIYHIYYSRGCYGFKPKAETLRLSLPEYVHLLEKRKEKEVPTHHSSYNDFMKKPFSYRCEAALEISKELVEKEWSNAEKTTEKHQILKGML